MPRKKLPQNGSPQDQLLRELRDRKERDIDWRGGRNFAYVYYAGEEVLQAVQAAYQLYFSENALNPSAFPSLRDLERETISMIAELFHAPDTAAGSLTSGGTESILMAVKSARSWAARNHPEIQHPEIVLSETAHPAFHKACSYFGLRAKVVPVGTDFRVSAVAMEAAITEQTVLVVASAPAYPHGLIDPVSEVAELAAAREILCHVDACVGGFMLPFLELEGYPLPFFDFRVPGVTSISADIHKYGYAAKGASSIIYRNRELHKDQFYVYTDWPGGIYASPSVQGTRPGGAIAAAWMALQFLGENGYRRLARQAMETALAFRTTAAETEGVEVIGNPDMTIFALTSDKVDIYEVGDELSARGWYLDRQQLPPSLHFTITPAHATLVGQWSSDLREAVQRAGKPSLQKAGKKVQLGLVRGLKKTLPAGVMARLQRWAGNRMPLSDSGRQAAMYGMMGELRGDGELDELVKSLLARMINDSEE